MSLIWWPKSHIASPFHYLDLSSGMMPLMALLASCDIDASINSITWPRKLCCTSFRLPWLNKCSAAINDGIIITMILMPVVSHDQICHVASPFDHLDLAYKMVPLMTLLASCDTTTSISGITWPKMLCWILFQSSWPIEYSDAIDNAIGITWCWWQSQVSNN